MDSIRSECGRLCAQVHIEKGVIKAEDLTAMIEELENYGSRGLGPRIIARSARPRLLDRNSRVFKGISLPC